MTSTTYPLPEPFGGAVPHRHGARRGARLAWALAQAAEGGEHENDADSRGSHGHHHGGHGRGRRGPGSTGVPGFGPTGPLVPGFGPTGPLGPGFGLRGPGGPGGPRRRGGGRRGGRGGRGDVRAAILLLLAEQPMHGYQLIQQIVERSERVWTPSPGSVYPALSQLEDEGLVTFDRVEGRKTASLTEAGHEHVETHRADLGAPWDDVSGGTSRESRDLREEIGALMGAAHQVSTVGTRAQVGRAGEVLAQARRALYRLLAEDDTEPAADAQGDVQGDSRDDETS